MYFTWQTGADKEKQDEAESLEQITDITVPAVNLGNLQNKKPLTSTFTNVSGYFFIFQQLFIRNMYKTIN